MNELISTEDHGLFPEGSGVIICKRCGQKFEGLDCLCIQRVADLESVKLCRDRLADGLAVASVWAKPTITRKFGVQETKLISHLRVRPGLTACLKKTPIQSKYLKGLVTEERAKAAIDCPKCIAAMGWE